MPGESCAVEEVGDFQSLGCFLGGSVLAERRRFPEAGATGCGSGRYRGPEGGGVLMPVRNVCSSVGLQQ